MPFKVGDMITTAPSASSKCLPTGKRARLTSTATLTLLPQAMPTTQAQTEIVMQTVVNRLQVEKQKARLMRAFCFIAASIFLIGYFNVARDVAEDSLIITVLVLRHNKDHVEQVAVAEHGRLLFTDDIMTNHVAQRQPVLRDLCNVTRRVQ